MAKGPFGIDTNVRGLDTSVRGAHGFPDRKSCVNDMVGIASGIDETADMLLGT